MEVYILVITLHFLFFIFFFFFLCLCLCCNGVESYNVWSLNQSFNLNTSVSNTYILDHSTTPNLLFFPDATPFFTSISNSESGNVYVFLCFISADSTPHAYTLSICFNNIYGINQLSSSKTAVVWSANRNNPIREENASLTLDNKGNLLLRGGGSDAEIYWATNTSNQGVARMELSTGPINLALFDSNNKIVWQSINYPTDTLTLEQPLERGMKLVSWASPTDPSEGDYSLVVEPVGVGLYIFPESQPYKILLADSNLCSDTLQSLHNYSCSHNNFSTIFISGFGLSFGTFFADKSMSSILIQFQSSNSNSGSLAKLEWNGNLQAYAFKQGPFFSNSIPVMDVLLDNTNLCSLPMHCGPYGVCRGKGQCACPSQIGNDTLDSFVELGETTGGCDLARPLYNCSNPNPNPYRNPNPNSENASQNLKMLEFSGLDYFSNLYTSPLNLSTEKHCKDECLSNCSCLAAFWHNHSLSCFHTAERMGGLLGSYVDERSVEITLNGSYRAFLKVNNESSEGVRNESSEGVRNESSEGVRAPIRNYVIGVICGAILIALFVFSSLVYCAYCRVGTSLTREEEEAIMGAIPGLLKRFSYKHLHSMTNGFANKLGQGGFGSVYAGTLLANNINIKVAVKQLERRRQGDKEFLSEVNIMGGIHHFNLLRLIGFCAQGSHRLIVYEYMENGSLDQWLFIKHQDTMKTPLPWDVRYKIALGAAQGLAYLHGECRERILHLDIKPQNILLDENFVAKVADFGLSRLMERDKSRVMTTMRGTPGYLAPEWLKEGPIDEKCDVFSFGMLLMEIISGRKNFDDTLESEGQTYYPEWAFWKAQEESGMVDLTDAKVESEEEQIEVKKMINIAFLCVLENPTLRPSMVRVVQMLEGHVPVSHIQLASLHQGLLFVLRNPSSFDQTQIEGTLANILVTSSSASQDVTCSGGVMSSFNISTR